MDIGVIAVAKGHPCLWCGEVCSSEFGLVGIGLRAVLRRCTEQTSETNKREEEQLRNSLCLVCYFKLFPLPLGCLPICTVQHLDTALGVMTYSQFKVRSSRKCQAYKYSRQTTKASKETISLVVQTNKSLEHIWFPQKEESLRYTTPIHIQDDVLSI